MVSVALTFGAESCGNNAYRPCAEAPGQIELWYRGIFEAKVPLAVGAVKVRMHVVDAAVVVAAAGLVAGHAVHAVDGRHYFVGHKQVEYTEDARFVECAELAFKFAQR